MVTKKWWQSKTIWLNGLSAIFGAFILITPYIDETFLTSVGIGNPKKWLAIIGIINTIGNVVLRAGGQPTVISSAPKGTPVDNGKISYIPPTN